MSEHGEFQIGDIVSIRVEVTATWPEAKEGPLVMGKILGDDDEQGLWFPEGALTLVERPKKRLRTGAVYRCQVTPESRYVDYLVVNNDRLLNLVSQEIERRADITIDTHSEIWREVPVEELEKEVS